MQLQEEWRALSARIDGLLDAARFLVAADVYKIGGNVEFRRLAMREAQAISAAMGRLASAYPLPEDAKAAIQELHSGPSQEAFNTGQAAAFAGLAIFRVRFDYALRDFEAEARSLVELGLEHLRRSILADESVAAKWQKAFGQNETQCEKLGAVHLLAHGVWAFKVSGERGITDLVCSEPIEQQRDLIQRTARTLALTEWKRAEEPAKLEDMAAEARAQAKTYAGGTLQALELKRTRYVVLVTEKDLLPPTDEHDGEILYRHVVIPTRPDVPSKAARRRAERAANPR